ncbi:MAG: DegT/DnrJ/EryC1/StrS family aminotransferase [Candidatus Bathyarchaeota archaeon]|nr:DegT/DnrJ/EryC1/StrS family aminotransferase [Candidatus Bathyarchaeota archaeon]
MAKWRIPLYKIYWDEEDVNHLLDVIRQGMFWATGPNIEQFETLVAQYLDREYAVAFNSGTSALHAVLLACGIQDGEEVIVPSFTFIATANSVLFVNAKPVFADIETETYGLDPTDVERKITKKTKAVMPMHYGGSSCQIRALKEIAEDHKLLLLEDAAESLGARINGELVGSFGDAAMFSFCGNKVITTGEGGMIVTDQRDIYERLKLIRSHGRLETENYFTSIQSGDYVVLGYNWRMSNITAALGVTQLEKLDKLIEMRRRNAAYMSKNLSDVSKMAPPNPPEGVFHVYQMYTVRVKSGEKARDGLRDHLATKGVMTKVYFSPVHLTHFYREKCGFKGGELPVTEELSNKVLSLPMYASMTTDDMDYVTDSVRDFLQKTG